MPLGSLSIFVLSNTAGHPDTCRVQLINSWGFLLPFLSVILSILQSATDINAGGIISKKDSRIIYGIVMHLSDLTD